MDEIKDDDDGMPIPDYAEGTRILVIDPDMASRMHVTALLEAATYRVTSTGVANTALVMIKELADEYDLVVAATKMQGMDCLTFLKTLKTLSKIPIVLISNELDNQLAIKTMKLGASQYFERPLLRYDARSLWQHVFSKGKKKTAKHGKIEENELPQSGNTDQLVRDCKGKGIQTEFPEKGLPVADKIIANKQNEQEMQKRKRSDDDGEEETGKTATDEPECSAAAARRKNMKSDDNPAKQNAEVQTKFTNALTDESEKAIPATIQQEVGSTDMMLAQVSSYLQHSNTTEHPNSETVPNASHAFENKTQSIPEFDNVSGAEKEQKGTRSLHNPGSKSLGTPKPNIRNKSRSVPKFNTVNGAEKERHGVASSSFHQGSQFLGTPKLNLAQKISQIGTMDGKSYINNLLLHNNNQMAVTNRQPKLKGKIDHIRHEYWTNTQPGIGTFIANYGYHGSSSSDLGYFSPANARPPHQAQSSENYVQPMQQNNLQTETTGFFQTANLPDFDSNYISKNPSDSLANQAIQPINNICRENLDDFIVINSSEEHLKNADASNNQQPNEDDLIFEEILAELQDDFGINNNFRSLGFSDIVDL